MWKFLLIPVLELFQSESNSLSRMITWRITCCVTQLEAWVYARLGINCMVKSKLEIYIMNSFYQLWKMFGHQDLGFWSPKFWRGDEAESVSDIIGSSSITISSPPLVLSFQYKNKHASLEISSEHILDSHLSYQTSQFYIHINWIHITKYSSESRCSFQVIEWNLICTTSTRIESADHIY